MNALRHGLYSSRHLLRTEDRDEYEAFGFGIVADLGAVGPLEVELAEHVVGALWRLRRFRSYEATQQNAEIDQTEPLSRAVRNQRKQLARAQAIDAALNRLFTYGRVRSGDLQTAWSELERILLRDVDGKRDERMLALDKAVRKLIVGVRGVVSLARGEAVWAQIVALAQKVAPTDPSDSIKLLEALWQDAARGVAKARAGLAEAEREYVLAVSETLLPAAEQRERTYGVGGNGAIEARLMTALDRAINRFHANRAALAGVPVAPPRRARKPNASDAMRSLGTA